jgi:hypothetical protein
VSSLLTSTSILGITGVPCSIHYGPAYFELVFGLPCIELIVAAGFSVSLCLSLSLSPRGDWHLLTSTPPAINDKRPSPLYYFSTPTVAIVARAIG